MVYYFDTLPIHPPPEPLESFTSYLMRLAEINRIKHPVHLASICFPNQNIHTLQTQKDYPPKSFVEMQQATTYNIDMLKKTTFYYIGNNLGRSMEPTSLFRFMSSCVAASLRYCPICIADYSYYFLPWRFLILNGCYKHSCQLLDRCGHCDHVLPFLSPLLKINICPSCGGDLRRCSSILLSEDVREDARKIYHCLEYLLSFHHCNISCNDRSLALGREFTAIRQEKGLRLKDISHQIGLSHTSLSLIELGESSRQGSSLSVFLKYAQYLNIDLYTIVNKTLTDLDEEQCKKLNVKDVCGEEDMIVMIQVAIRNLKKQGKPITLKNINVEININADLLYHYPQAKAYVQQQIDDFLNEKEKTQQFSNNVLRENTYRKNFEKDTQREEDLFRDVKEAIQYLELNGQRITTKAIQKQIGLRLGGGWGKYPKVRRLIEAHNPRQKQMQKLYSKQEEILPKVLAAIQYLQEMEQPITKKSIAKIAGVKLFALNLYPEVCSIITKSQRERWRGYSREQMEKDTLFKVQVAIQKLKELGQPITKEAIFKEAGINSPRVNKHPKVVLVIKTALEQQKQLDQSEWNERNTLIKVQQAIHRLEDMGKPINRETIAKEGHIQDYKLKKYPKVMQFIENVLREKTKKSLENQFRLKEEQNVCNVLLAIQQLQLHGLLITKKAISEIVGVSISGLVYYPKVKVLLEEAVENYRQKKEGSGGLNI